LDEAHGLLDVPAMNEELASEWFAKGESLDDIEELDADLDLDPDDPSVPNLRPPYKLTFLAVGVGTAILLFVASVAGH